MKDYMIASIAILLIYSTCVGCGIPVEQYTAETAFYNMQKEAYLSMNNGQQQYKLVEIKPTDPNKPIVLDNVSEFNIYAPPIANGNMFMMNGGFKQYERYDPYAKYVGLLSQGLQLAVPAWAAVTSIKHIANMKGSGVNVHNSGTNSSFDWSTRSGTFLDMTHKPTIVKPEVIKP